MWTYETAHERLRLICKRPRMYAAGSEAFVAMVIIILESMGKDDAMLDLWDVYITNYRPRIVPSSIIIFPDMTDEWLAAITRDVMEMAESLRPRTPVQIESHVIE